MVETGENPEHGTLAAAGWAHKYRNLTGVDGKINPGDHVLPLAGDAVVCLACDVDFKLHGAATAIVALQMAAPMQGVDDENDRRKRQRIGK